MVPLKFFYDARVKSYSALIMRFLEKSGRPDSVMTIFVVTCANDTWLESAQLCVTEKN